MQFKYGSYTHANNSVQFTYTKKPIYSQVNKKLAYKVRIDVLGWLRGYSTQAEVTTAIEALETAYATDGQDVDFLDNSATATPHSIDSSASLNGTRVVLRPTFPEGMKEVWGAGPEYHNRRTFRLAIEAEIPDTEGTGLVMYREKVRIIRPGFSDFVIQESINGNPQRQDTKSATKYVAQQQGVAIGYLAHPTFPAELYGKSNMKPYPYLQEMGDAMEKGVNTDTYFPISWLYQYETAGQISIQAPIEPTT